MAEIQAILQGNELLTAREAGFTSSIDETGSTFEENALIKARTVCAYTGMPTIADDSGLAVDCLDGAPGVYSARYAGEGATDDANIDKLLNEIKGCEGIITARFVCCIAVVYPDGCEYIFGGECAGEIIRERRGHGGFGYDPVFLEHVTLTRKTFAEMSIEEKNCLSHRSHALQKLRAFDL